MMSQRTSTHKLCHFLCKNKRTKPNAPPNFQCRSVTIQRYPATLGGWAVKHYLGWAGDVAQ